MKIRTELGSIGVVSADTTAENAPAGGRLPLPPLVERSDIPPIVGGALLPRAVKNAWTFELGRTPAFAGGRAPDGMPKPRKLTCGTPLAISKVMADLHRRELPPLKAGTAGELIANIGLAPNGAMANYLRQFDRLTHLLEHEDEPFALATRFAFAHLLASAADDRGRIDLASYWARAKPEEAADMERLVRFIGKQKVGPRLKQYEDAPYELCVLDTTLKWLTGPAGKGEYQFFRRVSRAIVAEQKQNLEEPMPLLDEVVKKFGPPHPDDVLWRREHVLGSNTTHHAADRIARAGKLYSTSVPVMLHLGEVEQHAGFPLAMSVAVDEDGDALLGHDSLGVSAYRSKKNALLNSLIWGGLALGDHRPIHKFIAVDSGAAALLALDDALKDEHILYSQDVQYGGPMGLSYARREPEHRSPYFGFGTLDELRKNVSGVEHTRDGIRQIRQRIERDGSFSFRVVNAAESPVKLNMVALLCAWSVVEELTRAFDDLRGQGIHVGKEVILVGYGSTGSRIAKLMRELGYEVTIKETDEWSGAAAEHDRPSAHARRAGFKVIREIPENSTADIVLGCVGVPSVSDAELKRIKPGAVVGSASSSNKELLFKKSEGWSVETKRAEPVVEFQGKPMITGPAAYDLTHHHRVVRNGARELLVLNSGYAVDMTGGADPISPSLVQLTRALMLLASFQARKLGADDPLIVDLDKQGQREIATRWMELAKKEQPPIPPLIWAMMEEEYRRTMKELE